MSRATKWVVAITLFVFAAVSGLSMWLLDRHGPEAIARYGMILQVGVAVLGLSGIVFAIMALRHPSGTAQVSQVNHVEGGGVVIASQHGDVYTDAPSTRRVDRSSEESSA